MITKTLNLDSAYQDLFDEVRAKSTAEHEANPESPIINVNNLEAFFGSIREIAALDSKFLRLPLDEPLFEINANTRKIEVPAEFKSNGVSVQGDHLAEVIFFRIARFFDYKDLSTCDIQINWKMGAKEGKTTRFIKFNDVMVEPDETKSDCIIFGWPINDVVTEKSGALTFAVEFSNKDFNSGEILYRFNTLPITVNIKDGLIISQDAEVYTLDNDIINNLINSSFGENDAAVDNIIWLNNLVVGIGNGANITLQPFSATIQLPTVVEAGVPSSVPVNLFAQAFVDEGTEIQYIDDNNENIPMEMIKVDPASELVNGLTYYIPIAGSSTAYDVAPADAIEAWGTEEAVDLYMQVAKITADAIGEYRIQAQGAKFDTNHIKIGNGEIASTSVVTIPNAIAPSAIELSVSANRPEVSGSYSFADDVNDVIFLANGITGTITATPTVESTGALQYIWLKDNAPISEEAIPFELDASSSSIEVTEPGSYSVKVVNFQNDNTAEATSAGVIASTLAGEITGATIKYKIGNDENSTSGFVNVTGAIQYDSASQLKAKAFLKVDDITINGAEGNIEYQWMKQVDTEEIEGEMVPVYAPLDGKTGAVLAIENKEEGSFYPVIKNNLNGSIYTFNNPSVIRPVSIDDKANN